MEPATRFFAFLRHSLLKFLLHAQEIRTKLSSASGDKIAKEDDPELVGKGATFLNIPKYEQMHFWACRCTLHWWCSVAENRVTNMCSVEEIQREILDVCTRKNAQETEEFRILLDVDFAHKLEQNIDLDFIDSVKGNDGDWGRNLFLISNQ